MSSFEGEFISQARKSAGMNQKYVAKQIGVSAQFFGRVEKGSAGLPARFAKAFCEVTQSSIKAYAVAKTADFTAALHRKLGL